MAPAPVLALPPPLVAVVVEEVDVEAVEEEARAVDVPVVVVAPGGPISLAAEVPQPLNAAPAPESARSNATSTGQWPAANAARPSAATGTIRGIGGRRIGIGLRRNHPYRRRSRSY
jgi:hypothetical protein